MLFVIFITILKYLSVDRTAVERAGGVRWHGEWYLPCEKSQAEHEFIGRTTDGGFIYYDGHNSDNIVVRHFLDQYGYSKGICPN